jgi:hypothetical protein
MTLFPKWFKSRLTDFEEDMLDGIQEKQIVNKYENLQRKNSRNYEEEVYTREQLEANSAYLEDSCKEELDEIDEYKDEIPDRSRFFRNPF